MCDQRRDPESRSGLATYDLTEEASSRHMQALQL
jgi:hypothetical protein